MLAFKKFTLVLFVAGAGSVLAGEPVHAYLVPPSQLETAVQSLEILNRHLPEAKARWASSGVKRVTYTVDGYNPYWLPCPSVPIVILATPTKVLSATYSSTQGSCKKGARVDPDFFPKPPSPAALFDRVEQLARSYPGCLSVKFNARLGIPEEIGCRSEAMDGSTLTLITNIKVVQ